MPLSDLYSFPDRAQVFAEADFLELDATYHAASEMEYLINAVTFNYTTMHCKFNVKVMLIIRSGHVPVQCSEL